jgi:hypothetical protein
MHGHAASLAVVLGVASAPLSAHSPLDEERIIAMLERPTFVRTS